MTRTERSVSAAIPREQLLAQLERAQPRILSIVAPAGFGKSTLARQYCQRLGAFTVCDLAGVHSQAEFARRLTTALAAEAVDRAAELVHLQLSMSEGGPTDADKTNLILQAWSRPGNPSTFVFENAERIDDNASVQELLWRLLAALPQSRSIVICSRTPLRARLSRFAEPHDIVSLHAAQLVFDRKELEAAFAGIEVTSGQVDRVMTLSRGWPIAVLLFVRFAREGTLDELLAHMDDVAFENLHDYLAEQVLGAWSRETLEVLGACACITGATADDVRFALGIDDAKSLLDEVARTAPFVTRSHDHVYEIHPLLRGALLEANKDRRAAWLDAAARAWSERDEFVRAARLRLEAGDAAGAADELVRVDVVASQVFTVEYTSVLAALPAEVVARHAQLWYGTVHLRRYRIDNRIMLREARALWPTIADKSFAQRIPVCVFYALLASDFGEHTRAEELLRGFIAELDAANPEKVALAKMSMTHILAAVVGRTGRLREAQQNFELAWPLAVTRPVSGAVAAMNRASEVERMLGEHERERESLDVALDLAHKTGFTTMVARALSEASFGAWFAGEDEAFEGFIAQLKERVDNDSIRGFSHYVACATDGDDKTPVGTEEPLWLARAYLVAWSFATDDVQAAEFATRAVRGADEYRDPAMQTITRLALAHVLPARRNELIKEAADFAARVESAPLQNAAAASGRGDRDASLLAPMFDGRKRRARTVSVAPLEVDFLTASIRRHGKPVQLGRADIDVLYSLALGRGVVTAAWLASTLWPSMDADAAEDALDHALMRLRAALGSDAFTQTPAGFRLCEGTKVDLWEIEDAASDTRGVPSLSEAERSRLHALHDKIRLADAPATHRSPVVELAERRIREYRREIAERLGRDALARHAGNEALAYAREMAGYDRWDQTARELAIQALLVSGDNAAALKEFEDYQKVLKHELHAEPSGSMKKQLKETFANLLHPDTLFDVGADAVNLLVPGGGIALRVVKAIAAKRHQR